MKIALVAVNAKYPHTNPAIRSLKSAAKRDGFDIELKEYTVNMPLRQIVDDLYDPETGVYGLSAYIWNIEILLKIASAVKILNPGAAVLLGGPEVSFETKDLMAHSRMIDYVIAGEGEEAFACFLDFLGGSLPVSQVPSLFYRDGEEIRENPPASAADLNDLPFIYEDIAGLQGRVIYYESSRGCPYRCSFCLSSAAEGVRFRSIEHVKRDIGRFIKAGVMKVKFVDRTFNADRGRAREILTYIIESSVKTGFHFEISASLLDDETIALLQKSPKGLIQVEAGVQSVYPQTLQAVNRNEGFEKIKANLLKLMSLRNIHTHIDLIAGLPYEGYAEFRNSFDSAFFLKPDDLQLGFLKLLKGCALRDEAGNYGIHYEPYAPYTVLRTNHISFAELMRLRRMETLLSRLYNSGLLSNTVYYLAGIKKSAFVLFEELDGFFHTSKVQGEMKQTDLCEMLFRYALHVADESIVKNLMRLDLCMGRAKVLPGYLYDERSAAFEKDFTKGEEWRPLWETVKIPRKDCRVAMFDIDAALFLCEGCLVKAASCILFDYTDKRSTAVIRLNVT